MGYRTTVVADEDIIQVYLTGAARFGIAKADQYFAGLKQCFELLADRPLLARERRELTPPIQIHGHRAHIVAYVVRGSDILIIRVLDGRQNWMELLQAGFE